MNKNPLIGWDFTIGKEYMNEETLKETLKTLCRDWCFQLEKGEGGYEHYQGRIRLKEKTRMTGLKKNFCKEIHLSATSNENTGNMFYVMKEESRIGGPWSNKDGYIPRQVREIEKLYDWQQQIVDDRNNWNTRNINIVIDKKGNNGKSILKTYVSVMKLGRALPPCNDYKDLMRIIMDTKKEKLYIIDMPRAINKDRLNQFFSGIETLKDGYAYDDRYHFKDEYFDCPNIWVFMNYMPDLNYLSRDRWIIWELNDLRLNKLNNNFDYDKESLPPARDNDVQCEDEWFNT